MTRRTAFLLLVLLAPAGAAQAARLRGGASWCGTYPGLHRDAVWAHREQAQRRPVRVAARQDDVRRVGQVAVLVDQGDLALVRNPVDLQGAGLRFTPTATGYEVSRVDVPVSAAAGTRLSLSDDDSRSV